MFNFQNSDDRRINESKAMSKAMKLCYETINIIMFPIEKIMISNILQSQNSGKIFNVQLYQ